MPANGVETGDGSQAPEWHRSAGCSGPTGHLPRVHLCGGPLLSEFSKGAGDHFGQVVNRLKDWTIQPQANSNSPQPNCRQVRCMTAACGLPMTRDDATASWRKSSSGVIRPASTSRRVIRSIRSGSTLPSTDPCSTSIWRYVIWRTCLSIFRLCGVKSLFISKKC